MGNAFQRYMMTHPLVCLLFVLSLIAICVAIRCWIGGEPLIRLSFLE